MATKKKLPLTIKRFLDFLKIFLRNKRGMLGVIIITAFVLMAIGAPMLTPYDTLGRDKASPNTPLSGIYGAPTWLRYLPPALGGMPYLSEDMYINGTLDWNVSASHPSLTIYESSIGDPATDGVGSIAIGFRREKGEIPYGEVRTSITKEFEFPYTGFPNRFIGDIVLCANGTTSEKEESYYEEIPARPDLNGDGVGNETDKKIIEDAMGSSDGVADLDGDGDVDQFDLGIWLYGTRVKKSRNATYLDVPIELHVFIGRAGGGTWNIYPYYQPGRYYPPAGFESDATGKVWIAKTTHDIPTLEGWISPRYGESVTSLINSMSGILRGNEGVFKGEDPVRTVFTETPGRYVWGVEIIFIDDEGSDKTVETTLYIDNFNLQLHGTSFGLLGTDQYGRDLFAQLVYGSRISLYIGLLTAILGVSIGLVIGLAAGYLGKLVDELLMRFADLLLVIPMLPLLIVLIYVLGARIENLIIIMGLLGWMGFSRLVRSQVLSLRERPFVEAAKSVGAGKTHIITKHILPNVMSLVYVSLATTVPGAITVEASLAWLGFMDPTRMSWGRMLYENQYTAAITNWWWVIPPGLCIALLAASFILLGFALDETLNPRLRRRR